MGRTMDAMLWNLCQRDQLLALRDQVRKQQAAGSTQAGHVVAWMERILAGGDPISTALTVSRACFLTGPEAPAPRHSPHHAQAQMQKQ